MDVIIRKAINDDCDDLATIDSKYFSFPHTKEQFIFEINDKCHMIFVAVSDNSVIGYIGLQYVLDEGNISNVVVYEKYRRNGIADRLVKKIIEFGKDIGLSSISLEVRSHNQNAIDLYSKNNFLKEGILKNYYSKPNDDALIMTNRCIT